MYLFFKKNLDSLFSASVTDDIYYWEIDEKAKINSANYKYFKRTLGIDLSKKGIEFAKKYENEKIKFEAKNTKTHFFLHVCLIN